MAGRLPQKAIGNRADSVLIQVESPGRFGKAAEMAVLSACGIPPSLVSEKAEGTGQTRRVPALHESNPLVPYGKNPRKLSFPTNWMQT